ncbi:hypothetical protein Lmor_3127 [Legionella moravica]|uniref:Dot/Icm secretion system substrate n=1 Tax=Legionella moravica TaxID=39962 RepID=A0A378K1W6_9GAMM|nr:hypothetical protein [Legionella moravica]KTD31020.1 hypothetical protein Lmor_3127 [Legionella moravica]STX63598.1 Uncharacterised protein [Legionella moravica]
MGHEGKNTASDCVDNNFNIPQGLVAKKRDELLLAKISALVAAEQKETDVTHQPEHTTIQTATRLSHPTQSRPILHHRRPSRFNHQFFMEHQENMSEESSSDSNLSVIDHIKNAVVLAKECYASHTRSGEHPRHQSGWLTGWRHGGDGLEKAEELSRQIKILDSIDLILLNLSHFFMDVNTRYNNHSFASYLLDELNSVLERGGMSSYRSTADAPYDKFSWVNVSGQLKILCFDKKEMSLASIALPHSELGAF